MKNIVISGASKGIGRATAEKFVATGARVFNLSRGPSGVSGVIDIAIDLSLNTAAEALAETLVPQLEGQVDVLIHNAAKLINDTLQSAESEALADVLNINVIAPQRLNQALIPLMSAGSAILYIGSTLSEKAVANSFSYVTSKHAMVGMMRASCQDLAGTGIHTACICPGFTNTEMLRAHVGESEETLQAIGGLSTFGRLIEPSEIADTIVFCAKNPVINGAVIHANLGQKES